MDILAVLQGIFNITTLVYIISGVAIGIIFGCVPGLSGPIGVALLLPFTYGMTPSNGLLILGSIYMGATYGGSISAILLNVPGTGEAACTAIDGNAMARKGRAKEALYISIFSSGFGGLLGVLALIFFTPLLVKIALKFGPPEMFLFALAGITVVGSILGKSPAKGFLAVSIGLLISTVGMDGTSIGSARLTFGISRLAGGIPLIPVTVGLFAITEMLTLANSNAGLLVKAVDKIKPLKVIKEIFKSWFILIKSTLIGVIVGIIPGTGGSISSFVAYGAARRDTKNKDEFGEGNIDGIIGPESANNAAVGGSLVPLLALGIPGSATAGIIYGALTLQGLEPGPQLFNNNSTLVYTFMIGILLSVIVMVVLGIVGAPLFVKVLRVKIHNLVPIILILSVIGVYSSRNSLFDLLLAIIFGVIGVFLKKNKIPIPPIILGLILGNTMETNLRRCITIADAKQVGTLYYIFARPVSIIIALIVVAIIVANFIALNPNRKNKHIENL